MFSASDLRKGLKIEIDGDPYVITDFDFMKPGKGQSIYRCKLRNLITGNTMDKAYRSAEKIDKPDLMQHDMLYSYKEGDQYVFMNPETYEQIHVEASILGNQVFFLIEDMSVKILFFNDRPIEVELPNFIERTVAETEPGARGDTATNVTKPAVLDNGYEVAVPIFINEGDVVRIDTRTGTYDGRVNK
ncbi:MAG: elongation factor P [Spartobacteria bacterium]|nr:elongation factor P [Spartobacteria bacterium]